MDRWLLAFAFVTVAALGIAAQASRTVWDGLYTEEQAARGEMLYTERCSKCHGDTLGGQEAAPALTGPSFYSNWEGENLEKLLDRIRMTMPQDKPGSLSRAQNADILAFMFSVNKFPTGSADLPKEAGILKQIKFEGKKP